MLKWWSKPFLMLMIAAGCAQSSAGELAAELQAASRGGRYVQPGQAELLEAERLFEELLRGEPRLDLPQAWARLGFRLERVELHGQVFQVLHEDAMRRQGRGFYLFRSDSVSATVLQAPHSFKDEGTRQIVLDLFLAEPRRAAAWNTVPRHYAEAGQEVDADLAHLEASYFTAFARAFARVLPAGHLIQVHGFSDDKRRTWGGRGADAVVSSGTAIPGRTVSTLSACLRAGLIPGSRIYPVEVRELGATTNAVGAALRAAGHDGFVHVELDRQRREMLLRDAASLVRLSQCLPD